MGRTTLQAANLQGWVTGEPADCVRRQLISSEGKAATLSSSQLSSPCQPEPLDFVPFRTVDAHLLEQPIFVDAGDGQHPLRQVASHEGLKRHRSQAQAARVDVVSQKLLFREHARLRFAKYSSLRFDKLGSV
eukprot:1390086-Prymnesium_polylepis.1